MLVVDCHCHAGLGDGLNGPWDTRAALGQYLRRARAAGIDRTVVFSVFHSDYGAANVTVARLVSALPDRLIGFLFVHAVRDRGRVGRMATTAVQRWGFRGIKVHRADAPISREICEVARRLRLPVLYDVVGEVAQVVLLAQEYPTVNFIVPHLGSFSDSWQAQDALIASLVRFPNVYADTAGVRRFDLLEEAVKRAGARKILFGSDGPFLHPGLELTKIRLLGLPRKDEEAIAGGNLLRLIRAAPSRRTAATAQSVLGG
jgi:predicted TIM-barrel fold metal-dependent hydrolase